MLNFQENDISYRVGAGYISDITVLNIFSSIQ